MVYNLPVGSHAESVLPRASFSLARLYATMLSEMRFRNEMSGRHVTTWWDGECRMGLAPSPDSYGSAMAAVREP